MNKCVIMGTTCDYYTHGREHVLHHYNWHKKICDFKFISRTEKDYGISDIKSVSKTKEYMWSNGVIDVMRWAAELDYEYYFFTSGDVYILDAELITKTISDMQSDKVDAVFGIIEKRLEHRKASYYALVYKYFHFEMSNIVWCANNFFVLKRPAIEFYLSQDRHFEIWSEVGIINCIRSKYNIAASKYIRPEVFGQGVAHFNFYKDLTESGIKVYAMHAIKDYKILEMFFNNKGPLNVA